MKVDLRPYQLEAVEAARAAIRDGAKNILICAPTGAGKTDPTKIAPKVEAMMRQAA